MDLPLRTILLLLASNVFMTLAWYGHLRFKTGSLLVAIVLSWLIALPEYALHVPANRLGHGQFTASQLKIVQEAISVSLFVLFSWLYLRESPRWNEWLALGAVAIALVLAAWSPRGASPQPPSAARSAQAAAGPSAVR